MRIDTCHLLGSGGRNQLAIGTLGRVRQSGSFGLQKERHLGTHY